jgi:hypothetical protein
MICNDLMKIHRVKSFGLDYDTDYGVKKRTGWSVHINGRVMVQFHPDPKEAIGLAFDRYGMRDEDVQ